MVVARQWSVRAALNAGVIGVELMLDTASVRQLHAVVLRGYWRVPFASNHTVTLYTRMTTSATSLLQ